ncbi:tetratricopeptide repeat-containing glycosyltransferase family 2 protein [Paenibacillus pasadenensis]|uniref:Glycosyl transferase, group 2 family protein n=1 Tax=Paenibacillus pasadenensis TaxID=217090 RepID=A0A2N5NDK3_9BACL|nr:glycosyltransferase family 2 protein [Paenibacillus pasadenensis]PLT48436.1 glycosyl transferase, group 2 family protein [Paenibacillus pasadenensis]
MLISLCMIVKNEELVIERCLDSLKEVVDEIIVIDTGSIDRTKQLALSYTDHVHDFVWVNDFSRARNEAIRRANGRWILFLDADEYFAPGDAAKLRSFLEQAEPSPTVVYAINVINFVGKSKEKSVLTSGEIPRLFPNGFGIQYERPIHEQLYSPHGELLSALAPVSIFHTGYLQEVVKEKDKLQRNAGLFKELKQQSGFSAYDYYTLGNEAAVAKNFVKAIYYYERSLKKQKNALNSSWYPHCVISLVHAYLQMERLTDAWALLEERLSLWKEYPEYMFFKAAIFHHLGFIEDAADSYKEAISTASAKSEQSHRFYLESAEYASTIPMRKLYSIYEWKKSWPDAIYYLTQLLVQDIHDYNALRSLLIILAREEKPVQIAAFLAKLYDPNHAKHQYILFRASLSNKQTELCRYFFEHLSDPLMLSSEDQLDYCFLIEDEEGYRNVIDRLNGVLPNERTAMLHLLASISWEFEIPWKLNQATDEDSLDKLSFLESMLNGRLAPEELAPEHGHLALAVLSLCYEYHRYECFDALIQRYAHDFVLSEIADFMFAQHQTGIALDYYSLMLDQGAALSAKNLEHLALYHLQKGFLAEGLAFLEAAIEKSPDSIYLYVQYLQASAKDEKYREIQQKLLRQMPAARKMPPFQKILA